MSTPISAAFITKTRGELARLAIAIAKNIQPDAIQRANAPFIWSNYGSYDAGKSLIAEEVTSHLAGENVKGYFESEAGMFGFDSEFHSFRDNQGRQFQFCDIYFPWDGGLFSKRLQHQRDLIPEIKRGQTSGGIIFLHNAPLAARENGPAIEMNIRTRRKITDAFNANARQMPAFANRSLTTLGLKKDYHQALREGDRSWVRLVEITIHKSEVFNATFLKNFSDRDTIKTILSESSCESTNLEAHPR